MSTKKRPRSDIEQKESLSQKEGKRDSNKDLADGESTKTAISSDSLPSTIDVLNIHKVSASDFFHQYVAKRRPCVLRGLFDGERNEKLTIQKLKEIAGDCIVEVEKRPDPAGNFGQNRVKDYTMKMTISEFLGKLESSVDRELFYLSTQRGSIQEKFMGKLTDDGGLPPNFSPLSGNLKLESFNLWMGATANTNGSSSGLHHDFHDNFYVLHSGTKRFFIHPPTTLIPVYGDIQKIHQNGLISYKRNQTRADGVPMALLKEPDEGSEQAESDEDERGEEFVIGKGADYESSDDEKECDMKLALMNGSGESNLSDDDSENGDDAADNSEEEQECRPDHFSPIQIPSPDPNCLKNDPVLGKLNPQVVSLEAGQGLYLPASWFHCVFSSSTNPGTVHIAVNYWYHPPDNIASYEQPYSDLQFWNSVKKD